MMYYTTFLYFFFYLAEELYPPIRRGDEAFLHDPHIGAVNSVSCSPFSRYVKNSKSSKQYDYIVLPFRRPQSVQYVRTFLNY